MQDIFGPREEVRIWDKSKNLKEIMCLNPGFIEKKLEGIRTGIFSYGS